MTAIVGPTTGGEGGMSLLIVYRPDDMSHPNPPGAFVSSGAQWLILENPGDVRETIHQDQRKAARFDRNVLATPALLKSDQGGTEKIGLYPLNGAAFLDAALGKKTPLTATASDTINTITNASTGANATTIVLTTGTAPFQVGAPLLVTSGEGAVMSQITSWDSGTKTLVTPLLDPDADFGFDAGDTVVQHKCDKLQRFTQSDGLVGLLPVFCQERVMAGKKALRFRYGIVDTWTLKCASGKYDVDVKPVFSGPTPLPVDPSGAWDPTEPSVSDKPFSAVDAYFAFPGDPDGYGYGVQRIDWVSDYTLEINNMCKAVAVNNGKGGNAYRATGSEISFSIDSMVDTAPYPQLFFEAVKKQTPVSIFLRIARFNGSDWEGWFFYLPNVIFSDSSQGEPLETYVTENGVKGLAHVIGNAPDLVAYHLTT